MKRILLAAVMIVALQMASCTSNQRARSFGGTEKVELKPNEVLLTVTWKKEDMWITTKDTVTGLYYCREKSSLGVIQGTIVLEPAKK